MLKKILIIVTLFLSVYSFAQKNNASVYSFYGIGESLKSNTAEQFSMGGIGATLSDSYHINLINPAANTSLFFTTYAIGGEFKSISAKDSFGEETGATSHLSYLVVGVPFSQKGAFTFGLLPNTSVGYSLISKEYDTDGETLLDATAYDGTGGTSKVFFGLGYKLFKGFSLGLQGSYIFGNVENSIINQARNASLATKYESISSLSSFSFNTGFHYKQKLKNQLNIEVGGSIELENELDIDSEEYLYSVSLSTFESPRDTILDVDGKGIIKNPLKSTLGLGLGKDNKWFASVDYSYRKPIEFEGEFFNSYTRIKYTDYSRISIGGFYIPKFNSITNYWQRVTYRVGVRLEQTGLMIQGVENESVFSEINDFGISFGVGLPVSKQLSNLNLGFEFGKRGKTYNGLIQENYVNLKLGLSLNDKWFKKREIF